MPDSISYVLLYYFYLYLAGSNGNSHGLVQSPSTATIAVCQRFYLELHGSASVPACDVISIDIFLLDLCGPVLG